MHPQHPQPCASSCREEALRLLKAGINTVPIKLDQTKAPSVKWKVRQTTLITRAQIATDHAQPRALAALAGAVSGHLEDMDFDAPEVYSTWSSLVAHELPGRLSKLVIIKTPCGYGVVYRLPSTPHGNTPLATGWRDKDDGKGRRKIALVETRGEGGYFLIPPSGGRAHRTGRSYRYLQGDLARPPILSWDEHEILWDCARSLDELPEQEKTTPVTAPRPLRRAPQRDPGEEPARGVRPGGGVRPGEDYNQRGDWTDLLEGAGWTKAHTVEGVERWRRPGKERGHSATLGYIANRFYVFSTSAVPLRPRTSYDKFALYAALHHGGDYSAAARDLWHQGYGRLATTQRGQPTTAPRGDDLPAMLAEDSDPLWGEASAEDDIASAMEDPS